MVLVLDLLKREQHDDLTAKVIEHYGKVRCSIDYIHVYKCIFIHQIDVLVNNAGSSQRAIAVDTDLNVDRAVLELNTIGTLSLTKCVLPHMIGQGYGRLVVISSVAGLIGELTQEL